MASRTLDTPMVFGKKRVSVDLTFFPAGGADPTWDPAQARGVASVARSTNGTWLITLQDTWKRLVSKHASVQMSAATNLLAQFGDISNVGTSNPVTVVVRAQAGATPTDIAANANNSVSVSLLFSDSDAY